MAEVLVLGATGGREHALAQAMMQSPEVDCVDISTDISSLDSYSGHKEKPFVVIGPEAPLVNGLADELRSDGYTVFGVNKEAAQYEASKSLTTRLARLAGVIHPDTFIAEGAFFHAQVRGFVSEAEPTDYVIKADGLDGGKGVILPSTKQEARITVEDMLAGGHSGAGREIINFFERHHGPEVSAMVVVGGGKNDFTILPLTQDHKRLLDGDRGPNTGGMGAYGQVPDSIVNTNQYALIEEKTYKLLDQMEKNGVEYTQGVMYMGLMMSEELKNSDNSTLRDESDLIEINVRFGDPETQALMPLLLRAGVDVYRLLRSAAEGSIEKPDIDFSNLGYAALSVCLAAEGYPGDVTKGTEVYGIDKEYNNVSIQHAGIKHVGNGKFVTNGGRVLYVTGTGETIDDAASAAYAAIGEHAVHFDGYQYRTDIGWQARAAA